MKEEFNYAPYSRRLSAMFLDVIIFQCLMLLIKYWGGVGKWFYIVNSVAAILWIYFIMIYLEKKTGASLSKRIMGLAIIKINGQHVTWNNAMMRESISLTQALVKLTIVFSVFNKIDNSYYLSLKPNMTQEYLYSFSTYFSYLYWAGGALTTIDLILVFLIKEGDRYRIL